MKRNYKGEYKKYHSSTEQKKRRVSRNTARRRMVAAGKAKKGDKKDVAHKNGNPKDNRKSNLTLDARNLNRSYPSTSTAKKLSKRYNKLFLIWESYQNYP